MTNAVWRVGAGNKKTHDRQSLRARVVGSHRKGLVSRQPASLRKPVGETPHWRFSHVAEFPPMSLVSTGVSAKQKARRVGGGVLRAQAGFHTTTPTLPNFGTNRNKE
jgi:hypothetical protein